MDALGRERVLQRLRHGGLADQLVEALRAVLAREDLVRGLSLLMPRLRALETDRAGTERDHVQKAAEDRQVLQELDALVGAVWNTHVATIRNAARAPAPQRVR